MQGKREREREGSSDSHLTHRSHRTRSRIAQYTCNRQPSRTVTFGENTPTPYSHSSSIEPWFVELSLACIHAYPHCCCCAVCIRFGAPFSRQRSFCFLCCDMYLQFRGCPVASDIQLSVSAWYQKNRRALLRARCLLLLLLLAADSRERRCAVCGMTFKFMQWSGNKRTVLYHSEHERIPPHPKHTLSLIHI